MRVVEMRKRFDGTVYWTLRETREPWLKERKSEISGELNKYLQKPWFGAKTDGSVLCSTGYPSLD